MRVKLAFAAFLNTPLPSDTTQYRRDLELPILLSPNPKPVTSHHEPSRSAPKECRGSGWFLWESVAFL